MGESLCTRDKNTTLATHKLREYGEVIGDDLATTTRADLATGVQGRAHEQHEVTSGEAG
jgi:hypothetical protein